MLGGGATFCLPGTSQKGKAALECQCCFCVPASGASSDPRAGPWGRAQHGPCPFLARALDRAILMSQAGAFLEATVCIQGVQSSLGSAGEESAFPAGCYVRETRLGATWGPGLWRESMKHMPFTHALPQDPVAPSSRLFIAFPSIGRSEEAATDAVCIIYCILGGFCSHSFNQGRGLLHSVLRKSTDIKAERQTRRLEKRTSSQ